MAGEMWLGLGLRIQFLRGRLAGDEAGALEHIY